MRKSVVSIVKGTDAEKMVEESLSLLGGVEALIKPGSVVVIKPNAGHPFPPESSVNTSPAIVAAVIKELRKARPKEIILAEAAAMGCDTLECFQVSGIGKAAEGAGVDRIIDIKREKDLIKITFRETLNKIVDKLLSENTKAVEDALVDEKAVHFLIGQLMKETKGKADPQIVNGILRKKIDLKRKSEKKKGNSSDLKS